MPRGEALEGRGEIEEGERRGKGQLTRIRNRKRKGGSVLMLIGLSIDGRMHAHSSDDGEKECREEGIMGVGGRRR